MRRFLVVILMLAFSLTGLFSQETKIINGYTVKRGERSKIDLEKVSTEAYESGKIWIKLVPEMEEFIKDDRILSSTKNAVFKTGVANIDRLNEKFKVAQLKPMHYKFYEISPSSLKHREKHEAWGFHLWMELILPDDTDIIKSVKEYQALEEVEIAEPVYRSQLIDAVYSKPFVPSDEKTGSTKLTVNDPRFSEQWHYNNTGQSGTFDCDIDLSEAWDIERGNNQVIVAIHDQGIQLDHPDLAAHIWSGIGYDFQANNSSIEAANHGCHTAGTVSAVTNNNIGVSGIAGGTGSGDGVKLMSIQVYAPNGEGGGNSNLPYVYSADNGAAISQNSWGYTNPGVYSQSVLDGIDYFNANGGGTVLEGGLTIFAASNNGLSADFYPACYSGAMGVAATTNKDIKASYSNYGTWVEVSAPGGDNSGEILSCFASSGYGWMQGTSQACPHVSGVAALIISLAPGMLTNQEVRNIIKNTTDYIDDINPSYAGKLGTGRLNAYAALNETLAMLGQPPFTPTLISPSNAGTTSDTTPTFDWSDIPYATSYTILIDNDLNFNSPEVNQSLTSSTYTPGSNLSEGTYYWKVLASNSNGSSSYSTAWNITISIPAPGTPTLISPTNGSSIEDLTPTFNWNDEAGATEYTIQVIADSNPAALYIDTITSISEYTHGTNMPDDTYSWRVLATNPNGSSSYTAIWRFTITFPLPGTPTLISPTNGSSVEDPTPTFDWNDEAGATEYTIHVIANSNPGEYYIETITSISEYTHGTNMPNDGYLWRVSAANSSGSSSFSSVWSFTLQSSSSSPDVPSNVVTSISGSDLVVDWDVSSGATSYDVYSSDDPYGTFTLATNVSTNQYTVPASQAKLFYYIVAKN